MAFTEFLNGGRGQISWGPEVTFGSGVTPTDILGLNAEFQPAFNQNWQEILSAGADERGVEDFELGPLDLPFTLVFTPVDFKFMQFSGYSVADSGPVGGVYTHTFSLSNTIASFTLEVAQRHTTNHVLTLAGCFVKKCIIEFVKPSSGTEGALLKVTLDCYAKSVTQGSSVTSISAITRSPFKWYHTKLTLEGTEITELNNGNITIETGASEEDSRYCNPTLARAIGEPILGTQRIYGTFSINPKDKTQFDQWNDAVALSSTNKVELIKTASDDQFTGTFNKIVIASGPSSTNLKGPNTINLAWLATKFSTLTVTDDISSY